MSSPPLSYRFMLLLAGGGGGGGGGEKKSDELKPNTEHTEYKKMSFFIHMRNNKRRYHDTSSLDDNIFLCARIAQVTSAFRLVVVALRLQHFHSMCSTSQAWFTSTIISASSSLNIILEAERNKKLLNERIHRVDDDYDDDDVGLWSQRQKSFHLFSPFFCSW